MNKFYIFLFAVFALAACDTDIIGGEEEEGETPAAPAYVFDKVTVLEYTPAPGQFINESYVPADAADAARWAGETLARQGLVSLGAFGGYIVVKPSAPIADRDGYDFGIAGNPISTHNEPGIVWVSRDENGNGAADDEWYELRGSETGTRGYSVTYFRTDSPADVPWVSADDSGTVDHVPAYHAQNYYPMWCDQDGSFTLTGTLLSPRPGEKNNQLSHEAYGWGYADNLGSDAYRNDNDRYVFNRFDIADAVDAAGNPVKLDRIDFIKVQSAVLYNLGHLGEISTEVTGFVLLEDE